AAYDKVIGLNKVTYGGTLNMVISGRPAVASDAFKLFSATTVATSLSSPYAGAFTSIVPGAPGANLVWNTSTLATDGTLRITSTIASNIAVQVTGNQLTLSWPSDNIGWRLQGQTNAIGVGLNDTWFDVTGSKATNRVVVTINPANGSAFYRLVYP